jgi:hypothetical protein
VGHDDHGPLRRAQRVDALSDDPKGVDVEARVGLVQDRQSRFEDSHLEDLVALLFAAGEAVVDRTLQEILVEPDELRLLLGRLQEVERVELREIPMLPDRVQSVLQEVDVRNARNLNRILEGEKDPLPRPILRFHREQVLAPIGHRAGRHFVSGTSRQNVGERGLPGAVWTHDGVDLARADRQIDAAEDLLAVHGR